VTRGRLPQRAGLPGLNGGGTAAAVPPHNWTKSDTWKKQWNSNVAVRARELLVTMSLVSSLQHTVDASYNSACLQAGTSSQLLLMCITCSYAYCSHQDTAHCTWPHNTSTACSAWNWKESKGIHYRFSMMLVIRCCTLVQLFMNCCWTSALTLMPNWDMSSDDGAGGSVWPNMDMRALDPGKLVRCRVCTGITAYQRTTSQQQLSVILYSG